MKNFNLIEMAKAMKEHKLRHMWRYAAMMALLLTLACGQAWGTDFDITLDQFRTTPISGLVKIDDSNLSLSGGALQLSSGNKNFIVSTTNSNYKIKEIVFTTSKAVISYGGDPISENTFTPASPGTSFTLNLAASGGTAKITQMVVTLTTSTSETLEALLATAITDGVYTTGSSVITLSTEGGTCNTTSGQEYINLAKSKNTRSLTIATSSSYNIKFIALAFYDAIFSRTITASTGTYTAASYIWTPGATPSNSVTLTFETGDSEGAKIRRVLVGYESAGGGDPEPECEDVDAPTSLSCTAQTQTSLTFGWTKASDASGYVAKLWDNSSCTGDAVATENIASGSTETVTFTGLTAGTTYYCKVQSKGDGSTYCAAGGTTDAASGTTSACTAISPTWSYPFSTVAVGITIYPTIGGNTGEGDVTYTSSATGKITNACYATAAGSATLTANVAANGAYCSGSVTSGTITVVSDQSGLIKQTLTTGDNAWGTPSAPATTDGTNITSTTVLSATNLTISGNGNTSNGGQTAKITGMTAGSESDNSGKYMQMGFTVKSGKQLNVSAIYIPVQPVTSDENNIKAVLSDGETTITGTLTNSKNGKLAYIKFDSYGTVKGNVTLTLYAWGWTGGYRLGKSIVIDGEIEDDASSCPDAWSFHSKNSSSEWRDPICMELDGDGDFYISEETAINVGDVSYKVGYQGADEAKTTETDWQWMPMGPSRNWTVGAHPTASNAGGALGYFYIHSTYTDNNRYIGFFPSSYMLRQGSGESWSNTTFNPASSAYGETVWTTPVQKYTASNAADYMYTALGTGNGGAVGCAMSTAMRPIYLKLHSDWKASSPKFYIYYFKNGTDKNGWSGLMQAVSGTGGDDLVGWIPEGDWDRVQFVRFNPGDAVASWDGNVWNSTYAIILDSERNYYVLDAQGNGGALDWYGHWDLYHNGFYRIWVDNVSTNFALHYVPQYVLEYDNNGGSGSIDPQSVALDADPNTVTVKAVTGFTAPEGKHFVNWNTAPGGGGTSYDPSDSYSLTADATLYAQWAWNTYDVSTSFTQVSVKTGTTGTDAATHGTAYTVTLQGKTGYNLPATVTVTIGGSPATLTTDYTWNSSTGVLTVLAAKVTGDISISATGVAKTTAITLEAGEGGTDGSATATYGTNTITDYVAATRTGYTLGNYYKDDGDHNILTKEGTLNTGNKGSLIVGGNWASADAAVTLYAQWTAIEYTLSYDLAGGSVASPNPTSYTIESSAITLNNPTKTGYTFAGWTGTGLAEATTTVTITAGSTGNRSYTATWTAIVPSSVSLNKTSTTITVGGTETLTATISPSVVADNTITWTSSDADVATVDGGVVTAVAAGTATITATTHNDKTATCEVTVAPAVTYTVTYVYNGATGGDDTPSATGASVSLPNPTKEGYTLQGWYTSSGSLAGAATATYNPTSDITLYALWREDECAGGGGGGGSTTTTLSWFDSGTPSSSSGTPKKPDGAGKYYYGYTNSAKTSAYAYTLTTSDGANVGQGEDAEWVNLKYGTSLNVYADNTTTGGTPATFSNVTAISIKIKNKKQTSSFSITIGGTAVATNVSLEGANESTFTEYSYSSLSNLSGKITISNTGSGNSEKHFYIDDISITTAGDDDDTPTCYYVTYNGNGADGGFTKDEASHPSGSDVTVASNSFTKTGHTFNGWNTDPDGEGGTAYAAGGTISDISGNMTLYAQWEEEEDETTYYLVTSTAQLNTTDTYIIANSAGTAVMSTTAADTDKNPDDITSGFSVDGSTLTITSASPNLFKLTSATNGWLFKGGNGSGNYLSSDGTPDADLWYNTSSTPPNNTGEWAVSFAGGIATMKLGKATETTYHIYYDATNTKFIQSTTASNIKIYTSNSTPVYTVTYANGGATSGSVPTDTNSPYEEGATVTVLGNTGSLVKNGYTFAGWNDGSTDYEADDTFTMPAEDVTLTAVWTPNTYYITYNLNGASWAGGYSAPANYTVGTGATLPVAGDMTNTGYTFVGWYDNSSLTGSVVTTISTSDYGDKPFWAKWTENTYTVTYSANGGTGDAMSNTVGHYVTLSANTYTKSGYIFAGWNTATDGSGASYSEGEEIELKANLDLYAIWATDYTITWDASPKLSGVAAKPNLGGGNYTITASVATWTGSLTTSMISAETSGVTITRVSVDNSTSPKTITATFNVGATVVGDKISFTLDVPANGSYSAKSDTEDFDIDRCTGSSSGSDGVLFSAEFKDSGLGTSDICTAANTAYTFTTAELKAAPTGGSIKAFSTSNLSHMKYATNAISIAGSDGVIQIDLSNAIATNDLFTYLNVNSSTSSAYLRHTSPTTTTDQIALTVYNSKEAKVRLTSGFNGKTTLYIVRNSSDFKLHKAAVVRPAFLMLLRDDTPTSDTNLEGTDQELTTLNYLTTINGGRAYYTSPSSGNLKIKRSSSKNYINFNNAAGYVKIVLNDALQEGDVIGFDSYNTNELALTITATRSTTIRTTSQLYTVGSSSPLKGQTTFYLWQNSGSSDYLRGLQIARSGVAGGGGGTDKITTTLTWDTDLSGGVAAETGDADFTHTVTQDKNSLGAITYSSNNTAVATVNASGKVHIAGAGNATITATMAASGCYKEATISYNINVVDNCDDTPGKVMAYDLGCDGTLLVVVLYDGMDPEAVNYQWYRDGASLGESYRAQRCTVTVAGEYYVVVDNTAAGVGHCAMASENTVEVEARAGISAEKIVDQWYVKNGRRTPDIELVQTTGATGFIVENGSTVIWDEANSITTGFGGCGFHLGENGIIYLNGQADDHSAPDGLSSGDVTLTITAKGCGSDADPLEIEIHCQASTDRKSVAFVVDGTEKGTFAQADADHSTNSALYQFLDYTLSGGSGKFDLTAQNIYSSVDEKELREHYSQFDAIIITDDPSTGKKKDGKSYVDAMGALIDVRPILTMEAFVSKLANWKAKGVNGNPESPSPRQYAMTLQCKDHEIFGGLSVGPNVQEEEIDGVDYWTVTMVDKTKSPYSSKASDTDDTEGTPALQGFSASDVSGLLLLGEIKNGDKTMYTGVERQDEPAARLMVLGIQNKALPNALTTEGKTIIENAVEYLLKTNMEEVDDCSNYFIGGGGDNRWETNANWFKGKAPNSPMIRARILAPCEVSTTIHAAHIDIVTSGESSKKGGEMKGQLIIKPNGAVIVGGEVRAAEAPYFNKSDLKPTEEQDLKIETSAEGQGALILNNDAGDTKATVEYYSLGRKDGSVYQFQYFASPMGYLEINPAFAGAGIYTYAWNEAVADGWERRAYYTDVLGFEGLAITTKRDYNSIYTLEGALASTADIDIALTYTDAGAGGQNLIGNSWTAPINIASLVEAFEDDGNVTKTVNIYNSGNEEYPGLGAAGTWTSVPISVAGWAEWEGLKVIPAMQAFRIDVTSETKLTMNYEKMVRQTESSSLNEPLKAPRRRSNANGASLMRMRLESGNAYTDLFLIEGEQFSEAFDNGYEAKFIAGEDNTVQFYAMNGEEKMAVLATDALEGTQVGFVPGKGTAYTISFSGDGMGYYLNDLKLMTSTLINEEATYSFTFEEGDANRFYISRTPIEAPQTPTGVDNTHSGEVKAQKFIYNDKMYIMINGRVYSADGQIVK